MTKRETHLEYIRIEVAREGKVTAEAIRHYIENRVSRAAFQEAIDLGMSQHLAQKWTPETARMQKGGTWGT